MNIQSCPPYYIPEPHMPFPSEQDRLKFGSNSNYNEFNILPAQFTPYTYQYECPPESDVQVQAKSRKIKKNKGNDIKNFLPKTLESEKQAQEEASSSVQSEQLAKPVPYHYPYPYPQGAPLPKLQSDIVSSQQSESQQPQEGNYQAPKQKNSQQTKKPKKEHINTGHWSTDEHSTYIKFLEQYESIMTSSMMKKTSKIFKQMSELIGTRTPSQCRSHHQKFNPYALRGENGKRLPRTERSRAGRKKKALLTEAPKAEEIPNAYPYPDYDMAAAADPYYFMMYQQKMYYFQQPYAQDQPFAWPALPETDINVALIKKEEDQAEEQMIPPQQQAFFQQQAPDYHYEEYFKINMFQRNQQQQEFLVESRGGAQNDMLL